MKSGLVYHGTDKEFKDFNEGAIFFNSEIEVAQSFTPIDSTQFIVKAYLEMDNPLIVEWFGGSWDNETKVLNHGLFESVNHLVEYAKQQGYDGVIVNDIQDFGMNSTGELIGNDYIVFSNKQILRSND